MMCQELLIYSFAQNALWRSSQQVNPQPFCT